MNHPPLSWDWEWFFDDRDFRIAAGAWVLNLLDPEDMTWVAAAALQRGHDTQVIREVAGLIRPTRRDDGDDIAQMFAELGLGLPERSEAVHWLAPSVLFRLRDGDRRELEEVKPLLWRIHNSLPACWNGQWWDNVSTLLYQWDYLEETYGEGGCLESKDKLDLELDALISDARLWARSMLQGSTGQESTIWRYNSNP